MRTALFTDVGIYEACNNKIEILPQIGDAPSLSMEFGVHFQQRLGLTLALGQADLVVSAAEDRRANGKRKDRIRTAANDFHQDCCPPCASR